MSNRRRYPYRPGFKARDTSRDAAAMMERRAPTIRERVLALFRQGHRLTADEAAHELGLSILAVRPRITELQVMGLIVDSGTKHHNESGCRAIVWTCPRGQLELFREPA